MNALEALEAAGDATRAAEAAEYHKAERRYLGTPNAAIDELVAGWRAELTVEERVALAASLWQSDVHEARIAAAKLLLQARMRPDDEAWQLIESWLPELDAWSIADAVSKAAEKRLTADPARMEAVELWLQSENPWMRRAALIASLPLAKLNNLKPEQVYAREMAIGWLETMLPDRDWHIQKAIAGWLRDLSKHDPERVRLFMAEHSEDMRGFTRKDVANRL